MRTALIGCVAALLAGGPAMAQPLTVRAGEVSDLKAVFATVESVDTAVARARIQGTVADLAIDEGSAVTAGEVLAAVVDEKLPLELAALDAQIAALEAERALAATELERTRSLRASGTVSAARLDEAQANYNIVEGRLAAMRAQREVAQQHLDEGVVEAPRSGRVLAVHVTEGSVVLPGEAVATIAAEAYILRIRLPERHARSLAVGDAVSIGTRGLSPGPAEGEGHIRQIYPELDQGRVVADIEVAGLGDFYVGERVRVYVTTGMREAFVVPEAYVGSRYGVSYVRLEDGRDLMVQPGRHVEDGVEILAGIADGDVLLPIAD